MKGPYPGRAAREHAATQLDALTLLEKNLAWTEIFSPWIKEKAMEEAGHHEDANTSAEKRAEHLWSMKLLRELELMIATQRLSLQSFLDKYPLP